MVIRYLLFAVVVFGSGSVDAAESYAWGVAVCLQGTAEYRAAIHYTYRTCTSDGVDTVCSDWQANDITAPIADRKGGVATHSAGWSASYLAEHPEIREFSKYFEVAFDGSFAKGYQETKYRLADVPVGAYPPAECDDPDAIYHFEASSSGLDLYHGCNDEFASC